MPLVKRGSFTTMTDARTEIESSAGFAPIAKADARILVLGSLPGRRSLEAAEYYAHPQNAFWNLMAAIFDIGGSYDRRCAQLIKNKIAVWDVLQSSARAGSLDSDIQMKTAKANDFKGFFELHPGIVRVCFNGRKAEQMYRRLVLPSLIEGEHELVGLPSTSPAYAAMSFDKKLAIWRSMLSPPFEQPGKAQ